MWTFRAYITPAGNKDFKKWYDQQGAAVQAEFDASIEFLAPRPRDQWTRPHFDQLGGAQAGLGEIRFKAEKVQYRPIGMFGPAAYEFTLLIGSSKKGSSYDPRNAMTTALTRAKQITKGEASTHVWDDEVETD